MKYAQQQQNALNRLDQALAQLRTLIKRGENKEALQFMEKGLLKERFEEMQNIITISQTNTLGARGTGTIGTL
jgi:CHASE3 domain sensor protein